MNAAASDPVPSSTKPASPSEVTSPPRRIMSVDALRGFDMFWIIGADALVSALKRIADGLHGKADNNEGSLLYQFVKFLGTQLEHVEWAGFHFYDLVFPLFVFIMGVSLVFSLTKQIEKGGQRDAMLRLIRRFILMFVVALLYSGGFSNPWPDMRLLGVLNRIALCYLFGGLIFIFFKPRVIVGIAVALLIGYWAMMAFVPIRDIQLKNDNLTKLAEAANDPSTAALFRGNISTVRDNPAWAAAQKLFYNTTKTVTGKFEPGYNLAHHLDFQYLPGKKWDVYWDPEGFLSTIPAIVTCLLGVFAGLLLRSVNFCDKWKLIYLFSFGAGGVLLGWIWGASFAGGLQFPVVKKIWSSSFVLMAGGYSAILLGIFYLVVDVWKKQTWCQPFVWMGMNSITIYLTSNIIGGFRKPAQRFVGGDIRAFFDTHFAKGCGDLVVALVGLVLAFWFVRFLYRKNIFLRL